jgi:hypothetical protein
MPSARIGLPSREPPSYSSSVRELVTADLAAMDPSLAAADIEAPVSVEASVEASMYSD